MRSLSPGRISRRASVALCAALLCAAVGVLLVPVPGASAQAPLAVGIPVVVDPIRGAGEPDITMDNYNNPGAASNAWISGPGGSGAQTSFFWHSRDGGETYPHQGPLSSGHWLCSQASGGDSLNVLDPVNQDMYLTDQEALASFASAKVNSVTGAFAPGSPQCHSTTSQAALTADRPFEGVLHPTGAVKAPQYVANNNQPLVYLSWLCSACGGLAFAYTTDGATFRAAEPGTTSTPLVGGIINTVQGEGTNVTSFSGHGPTVVDPVTGYVFTPISCTKTECLNTGKIEFDEVVGKPAPALTAADPGKLGSLVLHTAADHLPNGGLITEPGQLFPVMTMDANRTLYEMWVEGNSGANPTLPLIHPDAWHVYYTYSKITDPSGRPDPEHTHWSNPVRVDTGAQSATSDFGWFAVGDPGKLAFIWLGTDKREHPSNHNEAKLWHPFMAVTTNGDTPTPTFQQTMIGLGPNHISDMCLSGTVGCITSVGNRNMADFISVDIGADGAAQMTWANDANRLATSPATLIPGLPVTQAARQVAGPRLRGTGDVSDTRFSAVPTTGIPEFAADGAAPGDAADPRTPGSPKVPQMDLTGSSIATDGTNLLVHMPVASLADLSSPTTTSVPAQPNTWWLTRWQFKNKIYFAKAENDLVGGIKFVAGPAKSFDRPGLNGQTVATLVDFQSGTGVQGAQNGNEWVITVPPSVVGSPTTGDILEQVTAYSMTDNGLPLTISPCLVGVLCGVGPNNNIPTIFDATADYNALLGTLPPPTTASGGGASPTPSLLPNTAIATPLPPSWSLWSRLGLATILVLLAISALALRRRPR
ncbi:MAG: hypothetical protein ABR598_04875 [Candidatus Dormibacteria bacterium]